MRSLLASFFTGCRPVLLGGLSNDDGDGNENGKKSNRFRLAKQQLCKCITLFCTFFSRRCTTTTLKCLISRFVEDVNTRQQLTFSFLNFDAILQNSTPKKIANIWRIKLGRISAIKFEAAGLNSLFKWRFRGPPRRCCLSSLFPNYDAARLVYRAPRFCHITPLLTELHWLNVKQRINFKISLIGLACVSIESQNLQAFFFFPFSTQKRRLWSQAFLAATQRFLFPVSPVPKATHVLRTKLRKD